MSESLAAVASLAPHPVAHRDGELPASVLSGERPLLTIGLACDSLQQRRTVTDQLVSQGLKPISTGVMQGGRGPDTYEYSAPSGQTLCGSRSVAIVITDADDRRRSALSRLEPNVLLRCFSTPSRAAAARLEARWGPSSGRRRGTARRVLVGTTTRPDPYPVGRGAPSPTSPKPTVSFDDALDLAVKVDAVKYLECTFASGVTTGAKLLFEEALRLAVEEKAAKVGGCAIL